MSSASLSTELIAQLRRVEQALVLGDLEAARVAWYELGLALSFDDYSCSGRTTSQCPAAAGRTGGSADTVKW